MDENTRRINAVLPEQDFLWLTVVAKRNKWSLSRALRWAVSEARDANRRSNITLLETQVGTQRNSANGREDSACCN